MRHVSFLLRYAAPPVLLMALIFWLGTDRGSAPETVSLLDRILGWLFPGGLSRDTLSALNFAIRKGGHFFGYALLGLLDARALRAWCGTLHRKGAVGAWGAAVAWAVVDEVHQSYSPSRGATLDDVVLDAAGAAAGVLAFMLWTHRTTRND